MGILMAIAMIISLMAGLTQVAHAAETYTVTFDANGGSGTMESQTFLEGEIWTIPECTFTPPEGKAFDYWVISPKEGEQPGFPRAGKPENGLGFAFDAIAQAQWKDAPTPATYKITVTNGKAYSDEACTTEVTSASEGTRVYFKTDTPPAGKFGITGWSPSTVEISYIYDVPSFLMPGEDVTINTLFADQIPYTVDLTTNTADGSKVVSEMRMACEQGVVSSPNHMASVCKIDLDNNGDLDISFNQAYTKEMTVLESTNLHGDYTITVAEAVYSPITFKFPDTTPVTEYPVWVGDTQVTSANKDDILSDGGKAKFDPDTNTLTLNDPTVTGSHADGIICYDPTDPSSSAPELLKITGSATLGDGSTFVGILGIESAIELNGTFDVNGTECGVEAFDVTISGGTVTAHGGVSGIATYKDITITGGTVDATGDTKYGIGSDTKNITISGGKVTATGQEAGIYAGDVVSISGGTVTAYGGKDGINSDGGIIVDGGSITATGDNYGIRCDATEAVITINSGTVIATGTASYAHGITSECPININGGTVKATGGIIGIYANAKLTIGNGITSVTMDGETAVSGKPISLGDGLMIKEPLNGGIGSQYGGNTIIKENGDVSGHALIVPKETVTTYPVWVGSTQVTSANKDDILGDGGKAKFDPDTNTLTLNDPDITELHNGAKIYATGINLTVSGSVSYVDCDYGIQVDDGDLTLSDGCSISIMAVDSALIATNITILGGTVTVKGTDNNGRGIHAINNITISGGTVTAMGTDSDGIGIYAVNTITISGDSTQVMAKGDLFSIYAGCGISISSPLAVVEPDGASVAEIKEGESLSYFTIEDEEGIFANDVVIKKAGSTTTYPVWVGSTQVTSANKDDILGDGGKAKYDPDTNTLTLNDPTVTGSYEGAKIYAKAMTLTVTGKVTLSGADFGIDVRGYSGYLGRLIITGNGTNIDAAGNTSGISAKDGVIINGGTIRASGSVAGISSATISISGEANVTATASAEPESYGIYASSGIGIFDTTVTATAGDGIGATGIFSKAGDITISGGTVTVTAGAGGIYAYDGEVKIENGTEKVEATVGTVAVRGKNGITIGDELMIKLPEGGTVESNSGSYDIMDGSSVARHALIVPKEATTYTVTFDANSGSGTITPNPVTVNAGEKLTLPECTFTPPSADKEFDKWDAGKPGEQVDITSDCVIRAIWKEKTVATYTVTFDANGHGTAPAAQTVEDGKTATKPADPTETGWTFGGWYKEAACTSTFDFSTPITADITLYAKWTEESVTPGVITYTVVSGGDSTWIKDSTSTITITVKRSEADDTCFSHFTGVQIDGTALAASDYEAKAGSTVITLKAATLQKLSTGSHTVTVIFDDGKAETSVTVKAAASPADSKSPKTGDSNHMGLWIILMIISVIWLGTAVLIRKKNRYTSKH